MIRENQRLFNQLNIISDGILVFCAMLLSNWIRFGVFSGTVSISFRVNIYLGIISAITCVVIFSVVGLYESFRTASIYKELSLVFISVFLTTVLLVAVFFIIRLVNISRWQLVIFFATAGLLLSVKRAVLRIILHRFRKLGYNQKLVLLVGTGEMTEKYLAALQKHKYLGYLPVGYVADSGDMGSLPHLGSYSSLVSVLDTNVLDEVVVALDGNDYWRLPEIIFACEKAGTKLTLIPFYASYIPSNPQVDSIGGIPMLNLRRIPLDNIGNAFIKRAFDIICASILIVLTSPIMLITAIGVKLSSPGPTIFKQRRVGLNKKNFTMYKFRSMRINAEQKTGWSIASDCRRTAFGSFIRKFSIDEFPQFFNVLLGDMSLVGPRPEVPYFVELFKEDIPRYMIKHQVRPGITGWAQVNGLRGDTSIIKRIEYDIDYIENWNPFFDIKILFMTVFRIVNREKLKPAQKEFVEK